MFSPLTDWCRGDLIEFTLLTTFDLYKNRTHHWDQRLGSHPLSHITLQSLNLSRRKKIWYITENRDKAEWSRRRRNVDRNRVEEESGYLLSPESHCIGKLLFCHLSAICRTFSWVHIRWEIWFVIAIPICWRWWLKSSWGRFRRHWFRFAFRIASRSRLCSIVGTKCYSWRSLRHDSDPVAIRCWNQCRGFRWQWCIQFEAMTMEHASLRRNTQVKVHSWEEESEAWVLACHVGLRPKILHC